MNESTIENLSILPFTKTTNISFSLQACYKYVFLNRLDQNMTSINFVHVLEKFNENQMKI